MDIANLYKQHPRFFWGLFALSGITFITIQSYIALPRSLNFLFSDIFIPLLIVLISIFLLLFPKQLNLLLVGIIFFCLTILTYFTNYIPKQYGTFLFLFASWFIVDWLNYKRYKKSIFTEILNGNYKLAKGILLSTFLFGLLTEFVNLPFMTWRYDIPIPSLQIFGMPALIAAFGWTPWVIAILAIFYPYTQKD